MKCPATGESLDIETHVSVTCAITLGWGYNPVVDHLPRMHEALGPLSNTEKWAIRLIFQIVGGIWGFTLI